MPGLSRRDWLRLVGASVTAAPFAQRRLGDAPVTISRGFQRVGYGQLHYRLARPLDAAAERRRPVVCFHQTPNSSQVFIEFMAELAVDRIVYAVDTPGLGESDLPAAAPDIEDYARAMGEFAAAQALEDFDVVGYHTGASIAAELARADNASIHAMLLVGLALFDPSEREGFFDQPWPKPITPDGSHLLDEWQRSHRWRGAGQSDRSVQRTFVEKIQAGDTAWWGARAVMRHDLAGALKAIKVPFTAVSPGDDLENITPRLTDLRPEVELVLLPELGFGLFEAEPELMARLARKTFDRAP
ncbi:MAG: alpha/beta fold hydrolase [Pseudomonadota bacterium]